MYSIKAITSLTGLTPETLRAWERRYDCVSPNRSMNGRRTYTQDDLEKLKLLVNLTRQGHSIGKIASLNCQELANFDQQTSNQVSNGEHALCDQIIESLKNYQIEQCEQLLKRGLVAYDALDYARNILLPALQRVGLLWHEKKINIAQEHMFSSCVKRIILSMVNNMHQPSRLNPTMLFATPSGEPHEFGILISCLLAASQQYTCYYVGADLPAQDILDTCKHLKPDVVVLGMIKHPPEAISINELEKLLVSIDDQTKIWLGGPGAKYWHQAQPENAHKCDMINDIDHFYAKAEHERFSS